MDAPTALSDTPSLLEDAATAALEAARAHGADAADVVVVAAQSMSASVRLGAIEEIEHDEASDLGLRVFAGDGQAIVSTNDLSPTEVDRLAERAVAMARSAPPDPYAGLAPQDLLARDWPDLDLYDDTRPDGDGLVERARATEDAARAVAGVSNTKGASASFGSSRFVLATSAGFIGGYASTRHSLSCSAIAGEGTGMQSDYAFSSARHVADLETPDAVGQEAGERAVRRLDPIKPETGPVTAVYDPRASRSLIGHLASAINGRAIARGTSFLKDRLEKRVFAPGITITDDPLRRRGLASCPFDAEGISCQSLELVADGVLRHWLLDTATARQLDLKPLGHARRGVGSPPSPGTSNLTLLPGPSSRDDLLRDVGNGIYVTSLIGMGVNMVTGDYSRGVEGFLIENGALTRPISEATLAGNLSTMFERMTPADDLKFRFASNAPTIAIEGLTLAGR